jgi:hypothetical protein
MLRRISGALLLVAVFASGLYAQSQKTITVRMLDSKTGARIPSATFVVRIDHEEAQHADWMSINEDHSANLLLPAAAKQFLIRAAYDDSTEYYVNCDTADQKNATDLWYDVAVILKTGMVAPNGCVSSKAAAKIKTSAAPGEFVFYVRRQNLREQWRDYSH